MTKFLKNPAAGVAFFAAAGVACSPASDTGAGAVSATSMSAADVSALELKTRVVETMPLPIDAVYRSMEGPWQRVVLDPTAIGWITSFRTEVFDAVTDEPLGEEFFCHSQLQLATSARLMVAAMGIDEIRFPLGFGIPVREIVDDMQPPWNELSLFGMVLNNHAVDRNQQVKIRFTLQYVDVDDPHAAAVQKLYKASVPVVPNEEAAGAFERAETIVLEGEDLEPAPLPRTTKGKPGHWDVPPGKQVIRQRYRKLIGIATQVHYGLVHMHNHGRSMKLTDVTEGKVLWETTLAYEPGDERVQITEIPAYSSAEGFTLYPEHEYEIESVYDNTTSVPVDAMAVMYLYHHPLNDETITFPIPDGVAPATSEHSHRH